MTAARTPSPYPIAALIPLTTPCATPLRGSSDGVSDTHTSSTAPQLPGSDSPSRHHAPLPAVSGRDALRSAGGVASAVFGWTVPGALTPVAGWVRHRWRRR